MWSYVWRFRVLCGGDKCVFSGYSVFGDTCGFVCYCVLGDRSVDSWYIVCGDTRGIVGYFVWETGVDFQVILCGESVVVF